MSAASAVEAPLSPFNSLNSNLNLKLNLAETETETKFMRRSNPIARLVSDSREVQKSCASQAYCPANDELLRLI